MPDRRTDTACRLRNSRTGRGAAAELVREGARVIVNGVTQDSVNQVVADLWWRHYQERVLARILIARDRDQLRQIIRERDANYGTWGCKFPLLCDVLAPADVALFTNPH